MTEPGAAIAWAIALLKANSTVAALVGTRVFDTIAPPGTSGDMIVLQRQSGCRQVGASQDGTLGSARLMMTVKAVTKSTGLAAAEAILAATRPVLHKQTGTAGGRTIQECILETTMPAYPEVHRTTGAEYLHYPDVYRVLVG